MIKMVVSDMDGTLLNNHAEISGKNLDAIQRLEACGITFAIASGRDYDGVYSILSRYGIRCEAILGNGAQYVDQDGRLLLSCYLGKQAAKQAISIFTQNQIFYMIFTTDGFFTGCDPDAARNAFVGRSVRRFGRRWEDFGPGGAYANMPCNHLQKITDLDAFLGRDLEIIKIEAFDMSEKAALSSRQSLAGISGISCLSSFHDNIEVTDSKAQKGFILEQAAQMKGFQPKEVMVVGDGMNDLSLFQCFPDFSCAPENADEEIKRLAHHIVAHHNESGFAEAVRIALRENGNA